jgi:hypothetical protein
MVRCALLVPVGFLLFTFAAPPASVADPIKVTFTVSPAPNDDVNSAPSSGFFTFDRRLIPPGGGLVENFEGLGATSIQFAWGHTLWTTSNADLGQLRFSRSGSLLSFFLGGKPAGLTGFQTGPIEDVVEDFAILSDQAASGAGFQYTNARNPNLLFGGLTTNLPVAPTPEPSAIVLLATGILLAGRKTLPRLQIRR